MKTKQPNPINTDMKTPSKWFTLLVTCERATRPGYGYSLTDDEAAETAIIDCDDMDADVAEVNDLTEFTACPPDQGLTIFKTDFLLTAENEANGLSEFDLSVLLFIPGFDIISTDIRPADTTEANA